MAHIAPIKPYDTFDNVKEHVKRGRLLSKGAALTISSAGVITVTDSYHLVLGATENDNLQVINSAVTAQPGQIVVLQRGGGGGSVVVKKYLSGTDNIRMVADVALTTDNATITLMWTDGSGSSGSAGWNMIASSA